MDDFDVFTGEINYTNALYTDLLNKYVKDLPNDPSGPNYQCARKLMGEECLAANLELECAFHLSESASATLRIMTVYRNEQIKADENKNHKITNYIQPIQDIISKNPLSKDQEDLFDFLKEDTDRIATMLERFTVEEEPFHLKYLRFGLHNNVDNFRKIIGELPKEWTVVQITAPFNPNENLKPQSEFKCEINSLFISVLTNDYFDFDGAGPVTVNIPANQIKEDEIPLFSELYSLLEENLKTIDNAQLLNNKKLVQNYWNKRDDIDLRMKSVINVMDKEWLGGWGCLLTGRLLDQRWREKIIKLVDNTILDWGFINLTKKQKILLYNLLETSQSLNSTQIKSCIRQILTEQGNVENLRRHVGKTCTICKGEFKLPNELCMKCLSSGFQRLNYCNLVDGIKAFSQAARAVKEDDEWVGLKKAKRGPVVLIVDERLDSFPWESLPVLYHHPVSRIESIHFLYYLYKIHENRIKDGYFAAKADVGRYVINPEKNLDRMEKRMCSLVEYWCKQWRGYVGAPPSPQEYLDYIQNADIFLYCGHGDGCRFARGGAGGGSGGVEACGGGCGGVCVLSGCGSVRLVGGAGRAPPTGPHHYLHIAGCPMVVGMLWEVTDLEVDKVVSTLVTLYVPSDAPVPWPSVGKSGWSQGVLDTNVEHKGDWSPEPNLLRAVCRARASTKYTMIGSSVVARGLPVRLAS